MTTTFEPPPRDTLPRAVADARSSLQVLADAIWAAKSPREVLGAMEELERLRSSVHALESIVAVELDETGAPASELDWGSTRDYLTFTLGGKRGSGGRLLRHSRSLRSDRIATWNALYAGQISPEQADVIVDVIDDLPVDTGVRDAAEELLLHEAKKLNATELKIAGRHLLEVLDPEGDDKRRERDLDKVERSAHLNRFLNIIDDGIGGVRIRGRGTVEDAAVIKAALQALSAPQPATDPDCGSEGRDERDHGARSWDALVETCQKAVDADVLPNDHGTKPRVAVTVGWEELKAGVGTGTLETGEELSVAAVRKLACDADILPVVLGAKGQVLDVGRANRLVTMGIWLALIARDKHCAFPGCLRPPVACDAHHIVHWIEGGPTSLDNLVLLCRAHHTVVHSTPWLVRLNPHDRLPEFKPPPGRYGLHPRFERRLQITDDWVRERERRA